jgi:hypothetical protein
MTKSFKLKNSNLDNFQYNYNASSKKMSADSLEDLDAFLFLENPIEIQDNPAPIPTSTLTSIELPDGTATSVTFADSLASSSYINQIAADESLVVLDDDKGLFLNKVLIEIV